MSLPEPWVRIGANRYDCPLASAVCSTDENGLTMELYSFNPILADDSLFSEHGGITINGVSWPGVSTLQDLVGQSLRLTPDDDPELAESVFWERGNTLEIQRLELECISLVDRVCTVQIRATLRGPDDGEMDSEATLSAAIRVR